MAPLPLDSGEETGKIISIGLKVLAYAGTFICGIVTATWAVAIKFRGWQAELQGLSTEIKGLAIRVDAAEQNIDEMQCISPAECVLKHAESQKLIQMQLDAGKREFDEIKEMLQNVDRKNDEQHQFLIEQLIAGRRK